MDIALVGAPGSGKSGLAHQLLEYITKNHGSCRNIDGYADDVAESTGLALGEVAGYIGNLLVASARLEAEVACIKDENVENTIVCGTIVDTVTYMSIHAGRYISKKNADDYGRTQIFMHMMGVLMHDMFEYDHIFYLPFEPTYSETEQDVFALERNARFDTELVKALELFAVPYAKLEGWTRFDDAVRIIETSTSSE